MTKTHLGVEPALVKSESRYRRLFEAAQDGILILNFNTARIEDVNPFLTQLLGYDKDELIGKELWQIGAIVDIEASKNAVAALQTVGYIRYENLPLRKKNGDIVHSEFVCNAYDVEEEKVIQCNIRDISSRVDAEERAQQYQQLVRESYEQSIQLLTNLIGARDPYTRHHQSNVADLSVRIGAMLGLSASALEGLKLSALVHDIGKFVIPAEILTKPTPLNTHEIGLLREHVATGYEVLKGIPFPWPVAEIVLQHHEREDGSGYPRGLISKEILLEAKIIAVADTVEAMSSNRPYRQVAGRKAALSTIDAGRNALYDSKIVDSCLRLFQHEAYEFPELQIQPVRVGLA